MLHVLLFLTYFNLIALVLSAENISFAICTPVYYCCALSAQCLLKNCLSCLLSAPRSRLVSLKSSNPYFAFLCYNFFFSSMITISCNT